MFALCTRFLSRFNTIVFVIQPSYQVVEEADVVLLVLDARDPDGCRSRLLEEEVRRRENEGKRLVFVLNKVGASSIESSMPAPQIRS
jgi:predicted GTPase